LVKNEKRKERDCDNKARKKKLIDNTDNARARAHLRRTVRIIFL